MSRKPTFSRTVTEHEWSLTILGLALLFGAMVRLLPALLAGAPINDGGMFAVMMQDLQVSRWVLPTFTSYNTTNIPFVYPPLGFYIGALFRSFGIPDSIILLWLPCVFAIATVPLFYLMAFELLGDNPRAATATVFFALAPGTYAWLLMGGGLTRALGADCFILSLYFVHRTLRESNPKLVIPSAIFCALTVMAHPQYAVLSMVGCTIFCGLMVRSRRQVLSAFLIATGTVLLSMPWWLNVITHHGISAFLLGGQSGDVDISPSSLFAYIFHRQTIFPFATLFWLLGFVWAIYRRRFDQLVLVLSSCFLDQRIASILPSYVFPMFAAYGFVDVLPNLISFVRTHHWRIELNKALFSQPAFSIGLLGIIFYLFLECVFHTNVILDLTLPSSAEKMMAWVNKNMPKEAEFIVLTGHPDAMTDSVQEWFPALSSRHSATTLQGLEWKLGKEFNQRWVLLNQLQACLDLDCVLLQARQMDLHYTYIVLATSHISVSGFLMDGYEILYDNGEYVVLK